MVRDPPAEGQVLGAAEKHVHKQSIFTLDTEIEKKKSR
jgi:hypothetical protein